MRWQQQIVARLLALQVAALSPLPLAAGERADIVAETFAQLDADRDGRLSADEYLKRQGKEAMHRRDFKLFDFSGGEQLSRDEFAAIPGLAPPHERGAIPDPFDHLLDGAVGAMDETYNGWEGQPQRAIPAGVFVVSFAESLSPSLSIRLSTLTAQADADRNGQVTRDEAKRFLQIQLGILSPEGDSLRQPNGRVVNWRRFVYVDADKDRLLTREEYLAKYAGALGEKQFAAGDTDGDGALDWEEFSNPAWAPGYADPVEWFLEADANFDGLVDAAELTRKTIRYRQPAISMILPVFDDDGDGKLSLAEYRVCPLGNYLCSWESLRLDDDRDLQLSFKEFLFDPDTFLLLQRLYFHRLDSDGNGTLDDSEYAFKQNPPNALYKLAADGSSFELLWRDRTIPNAGSPEISPDGKWIVFDRYPEGKILRISAQGGEPSDLCEGLMPTWSADGKQLAFSRGGISVATSDGLNTSELTNGWGAQWSPDGASIAYTLNGGLWVYDVESKQSREVLPRTEHPYSMLYYGMCWSPDSRRVAIKGVEKERSDIISVDMRGEDPDLQVHFSTTESVSHDLSWSPDGKRLVFAARSAEHKRNLLHQLDLHAGGPPTVYPGIDTSLTYFNQSFSRDGQWIVLTAK